MAKEKDENKNTYRERMNRNSKPVTITLTQKHKDLALKLSKEIMGRENLSGFLAYLIEKESKIN